MSERGIVYILTNPLYLEDVIKIGKTKNLPERIKQLNSQTAVPCPFACHYAVEIDNYSKIEQTMHIAYRGVDMATDKEHKRKEFFRVIPEKAQELLEQLSSYHNGEEVSINDDEIYTKEEKNELEIEQQQQEKARSNTKFKNIGIKVGETLLFRRDNAITCTVTENNRVSYKDKIYSLTGLSKEIYVTKYGAPKTREFSGYREWTYKGELLWDRRKRLEKDEERNSHDDE